MRPNGINFWDILWFFAALAVGLACSLPYAHAEGAFGTVAGKVTDSDYNPIPGAKVRVTRADHVVLTGTADDGGDYTISDVPPGKLDLQVDGPGFEPTGPQSVKIQAGDTTWVNPTLTPVESKH